MKNIKSLLAIALVAASLIAVSTSYAGHVGGSGHGTYDCETDTFKK